MPEDKKSDAEPIRPETIRWAFRDYSNADTEHPFVCPYCGVNDKRFKELGQEEVETLDLKDAKDRQQVCPNCNKIFLV